MSHVQFFALREAYRLMMAAIDAANEGTGTIADAVAATERYARVLDVLHPVTDDRGSPVCEPDPRCLSCMDVQRPCSCNLAKA